VVVGPSASTEDRELANRDFLRINEAYEKLKARQDEETFEIIVMGNGKVEKQYYTTSEERRNNDPDRVNFQRILEVRERYPNAKQRNWSDGKYKHPPGGRHNGDFGPIRR
jgi:adenine specific DNA methylase Mod